MRLRSESTRTIINATRAVFSASPTASLSSSMESERAEGWKLLVCHDVVAAMSDLARLGGNYPMLVNEAVVGMTLLAGSGEKGGESGFVRFSTDVVQRRLSMLHCSNASQHPRLQLDPLR